MPRRDRARGVTLPPGIRVREARAEDAEALHRLYHEAYAPHQDPHRPPIAALKDTLDDVRAYIRDSTVLVAEDEAGRIVATVAIRSIANLRRLAVAPSAKGNGLGASMLEAAVERAQAEGFEQAMLDTFATHPWLPGFYERHEFQRRGIERMEDGTEWIVYRRKLR